MKRHTPLSPISILLADDDRDDRFFFAKALKSLPYQSHLSTVENGELLLTYLEKNVRKLPDVLFLDLNMPRKGGAECLTEIKSNPKLQHLPVVIYSTSLYDDVAEILYKDGAHYYVRKTDFTELKKVLDYVLTSLMESKYARPSSDHFIITGALA